MSLYSSQTFRLNANMWDWAAPLGLLDVRQPTPHSRAQPAHVLLLRTSAHPQRAASCASSSMTIGRDLTHWSDASRRWLWEPWTFALVWWDFLPLAGHKRDFAQLLLGTSCLDYPLLPASSTFGTPALLWLAPGCQHQPGRVIRDTCLYPSSTPPPQRAGCSAPLCPHLVPTFLKRPSLIKRFQWQV